MTKTHSDTTVSFIQNVADTITAIGKIILLSRPVRLMRTNGRSPIIIMGNGPSLRQTIDSSLPILQHNDTLAVNFAANTPEFTEIKPRYYVLADPHFFNAENKNVDRLIESLNKVDWNMTLFLPRKANAPVNNPNIKIERFNMVGIDGATCLRNAAFRHRLAMPRPRNVLIPSIMIAIWLGYKQIYITGADHSWMQTISVNNNNEVVSVQPHFYKDDEKEIKRVNTEYMRYPLHKIIHSFYTAFKAYHDIEAFAETCGTDIFNSTPESFIDAFRRKTLPSN